MKLENIPIDDILVEERRRQDFGNIKDLVLSIKREGLIQPLAVQLRQDTSTYLLLAGERRLKAAKEAGYSTVPVRVYEEDLNELQIKSIELAENLYRKDFSWQEEVKLKEEIWELQKSIHGVRTIRDAGAPGTSKAEVARMIGDAASTFTEDVQLAQVLEFAPEVAKSKTKTDAKKLVKKIQKDFKYQDLAEEVKTMKRETPEELKKDYLLGRYILKDFFDPTNNIGEGWASVVEIDPPYAIELQDKKKQDATKTVTADYNEVAVDKYVDFMERTLKIAYNALGESGWVVVWFGPHPWFGTIWDLITKVGFKGMSMPGIWLKRGGQTMQPKLYMANSYEMFFYARKGNIALAKEGRSNVFDFPTVAPSKKIHPTERPIELIEEILSTLVYPRQTAQILCPFLGSGNTILAADNQDMRCHGYDLSKEYQDRYMVRVESGKTGEYKSYDS